MRHRIDLRYGRSRLSFDVNSSRFDVLGGGNGPTPLSDAEIGAKLDSPIGSPLLEDAVTRGSTLIVVSDATRQTAAGQIANLIVRRLIANGTAPYDIRFIFATGIHRAVTEAEKQLILTPFLAQRLKALDHSPRDLMRLVNVADLSDGTPVELNRALIEHENVILIGGVTFHYFAGFTGGRKLICPGLASSRIISATHRLAFDCQALSRREGVGPGILDGNAVHAAFEEAASAVSTTFCVSSIVNDTGQAVDLYCGDRVRSHREACERYGATHTIAVHERRDLVIVSCGGFPHDLNLIQAHKALDMAARACNEGGTIVLLAECADGLGRSDLLEWFSAQNSRKLAVRLCEKYQVNGQTAWSLLQKTERFDVRIMTNLPDEAVAAMRMTSISATEITHLIEKAPSGYVMPDGAKYLVTCDQPLTANVRAMEST
jgi:lactate racemase